MGLVLKRVSKISGTYGQPGEELISGLLADGLSNRYVILNSPRLYFRGALYDIDHVVIGPNGVFVIETKNMQGRINGGLMGNWTQIKPKTGRNSRVSIGNPANQVKQYAKAVRSLLGSRTSGANGQHDEVKVYPIVVFRHEETDLSYMEYTRPGFIGRVRIMKAKQLVDYITRRNGITYSDAEVKEFSELLVPRDQREQTLFLSVQEMEEHRTPSDRYAIFEELGRGSSGVVYRGFDFKLDKEIAVKKLSWQDRVNASAAETFRREANINMNLRHDRIVEVYDFFEKSGEGFMVMELVPGQTLEAYLQGRDLSLTEACSIIQDIGSGLACAHTRDVVHRDLKLSNIMITDGGRAKIMDFGIARIIGQPCINLEGIAAGTPMTMSPEQVKGEEAGKQADVFALGIIFFRLLTGKMPFDGEHIGEITHKILYTQPESPSRYNNEAGRQLVSVIFKALEKKPEDRFTDAGAFLSALEKALIPEQPVGRSLVHRILDREKRVFAIITLISLAAFISIIGIQAYKDSRELTREMVLTKQWGFTNENAAVLFDNPQIYIGLPVNLVGRLDRIIKSDNQGTQFTLAVRTQENQPEKIILIDLHQSGFEARDTSYIKVSGSVQLPEGNSDLENQPLIIADKVESIADPWSVLAPSQFTIYPHQIERQDGRVVELEKVEFAAAETRLYIVVSNEGDSDSVIFLNDPVAKQSNMVFPELKNGYRDDSAHTFQLEPGQAARKVIFLAPADRRKKAAAFILGSKNDILMGQEPYVFEVNW